MVNYVLISLRATLVVFSVGTYAVGTAMRHRDKIMIIFIIIYGILRNKKLLKLKNIKV